MTPSASLPEGSVFLPPDAGRTYEMGALRAVFKADGEETQNRYCVSEWWLEPNTKGPGAHLHEENDELFYVLEGRPSVLVGETWIDAERGLSSSYRGAPCTISRTGPTRGPGSSMSSFRAASSRRCQ